MVWHDAYVPVLIVLLIVVVLAAVVLVAAGRGGEMPAAERSDYAPLDMGPVSATDVVLLRPPTALWGYNQQATDEALEKIAESIRERDVRIVALEQLVTDLSRQPEATMPLSSPYTGARHARAGTGGAGQDFTAGTDVTPGAASPGGTDIADQAYPMISPSTDPLAAPVDEHHRTGWPPEVAH